MHYVTWLGLWVKVKCLNREEFVVVGWTDPEGARPWLGSLLREVVYEGLREDKPAAEVRRRPPHPKPAAAAPQPTPAAAAPHPMPAKRQRSKRLPVPAENILQLLPNAVVPSREELCAYWET